MISNNDPDPDMRSIALAELEGLHASSPSSDPNSFAAIRSTLLQSLFPTPTTHRQSALVEIKPGVGGVEAAHFATSLMNVYTRHALRQKWRVKPVIVEFMTSGQGMDGLREATLEIEGEDVYGRMRWEAGVHRVQRVPVMQNTSAVHTSTAAVIVGLLQVAYFNFTLYERLVRTKLPCSSYAADGLMSGLVYKKA